MDKTDLKPVHTEPRPGDILHSFGDISKASKKLGYKPKIQLQKGLSGLVKWYSKH
jgi:nucleoside-diphosphate-sugar epimerase